MVARLLMASVSTSLLALMVACGGGGKSPGRTATGVPTARSTTAPTPTLRYAALVRPISESDAVWDEITARVAANLSPVLRPPSPPEGLDTIQADLNDNYFHAQYSGPNKTLRMSVGMLSNSEPPTDRGHQEIIHMRGIDCVERSKEGIPCPYLQVRNDANPTEFSFLLWYEPGHEVFPDAPDRDAVEYLISGEGVEPQVLIDFASSLTQSGHAETPLPVTRIPIPWTTPGP